MEATKICDRIIDQLKLSNLNFLLQESPYSAYITIKKTFVNRRNVSTVSSVGGGEIVGLGNGNVNEREKLKKSLDEKLEELSDKDNLIHDFDLKLQKYKAELELKLSENRKLVKSKAVIENNLDEKNGKINLLENVIKNLNVELQKVKSNLNASDKEIKIKDKELNKLNVKCENLEENFKKSKQENKTLKNKIKLVEKDLSKLKKNVEEKLITSKMADVENNTKEGTKSADSHSNVSEEKFSSLISSSIDATFSVCPVVCSTPIVASSSSSTVSLSVPIIAEASLSSSSLPIEISSMNNLDSLPISPKGFLFLRRSPCHSNTSSSQPLCLHDQQCVQRQPFPPPLPSMTPLVNHQSKYHEKILAGALDYGRTCDYCMRIEYERYGCDSCVWIKCFGELHGYPDINPYQYHKYR